MLVRTCLLVSLMPSEAFEKVAHAVEAPVTNMSELDQRDVAR